MPGGIRNAVGSGYKRGKELKLKVHGLILKGQMFRGQK